MRRSLILLFTASLLLLVFGCGGTDEAEIAENLEDVGTTELLEKTAEDEYEPPADNRLTEAQIQMYLKVREHEKKIAEVARQEMEKHAKTAETKGEKSFSGMVEGFKALGSAADFVTADLRAASELGVNTAEYQWVKERVLEASGAAFAEQMQQSMNAMMDQAWADLKKQHDEATDPETKKAIAGMLADYEKGRKEMAAEQEQADPWIAHNRQLLAKYENEVNALVTELSKFEETPGQTQKALEDWQAKQNP
ncbi:MAG: hypothetical protein ACRD2J_00240 [Thermoanaerobaculia bacterium]